MKCCQLRLNVINGCLRSFEALFEKPRTELRAMSLEPSQRRQTEVYRQYIDG
jgi:hypothetical protein